MAGVKLGAEVCFQRNLKDLLQFGIAEHWVRVEVEGALRNIAVEDPLGDIPGTQLQLSSVVTLKGCMSICDIGSLSR